MTATLIVGNDRNFRTWIKEHPDGFVLNAYARPTERYLVLHTAQCPEWQTDSTLTEGTYSKIVADTEAELRDWMARQGFDRTKAIVNGKGCRCIRNQRAGTKPILLGRDEACSQKLEHQAHEAFHLSGMDTRELAMCAVRLRRGQMAFRNSLRKAHGDHCMITGCTVLDVLEAAHIKPYRGVTDNHVENGLLLRADIHTLFDLNLIGIDPETHEISIDASLDGTDYEEIRASFLRVSNGSAVSNAALRLRWQEFQSRIGS